MVQEVAGGVEVCEPVTVGAGHALVLTRARGLGVAVAAHDVVLVELAGSHLTRVSVDHASLLTLPHLKVLAARGPGCCRCCWGWWCCCCGVGAGAWGPGAARQIGLRGATGAARAAVTWVCHRML